jgi:hypothetical protein
MKLLREYIDKLPTDLKFNPYEFIKRNIHYLNKDCKDILLEDLIKIDFNSLYPNIILGLYNEGLIDTKWDSDMKKLKSFLENIVELKKKSQPPYPEDPLSYKLGRIHANELYGKIRSPLVVEYLHLIYSDIIKEYSEDIVYIDVDMIICKGDIDISKIPVKSEVSKIEYFYIENQVKYITFANGQLETRGHSKFTNDDLLQLIKREIRTRRLNKLGI